MTRVTRRGQEIDDTPSDGDAEAIGRGAQNIASGIFAGGAAQMIVGYRYMISVTARQVQISGPVDLSPHRIVFRAPRTSVEAAAARNDVVIGAEPTPGRRVQLVFTGIAGTGAQRLVSVLDRESQPVRKATRRRPTAPK